MLLLIALVGTIILCARFRIIPMVIISAFVAAAVYMFSESGILAFLAYFISLCPWNKFDEKRRRPKRVNRAYYDSYDNTAVQSHPESQESINRGSGEAHGNVYNIENMNVYVNPVQQETLPMYSNADDYNQVNRNKDWTVTGVDWDALNRSYKSWKENE